MIKHPAKFTDSFIPIFAKLLTGYDNVIDPMGGTGKLSLIKDFGWNGSITINEIEPEWIDTSPHKDKIDSISYFDASNTNYKNEQFDAICTSPTYGNRMADHHIAKDNSKRNTYTRTLGRQLSDGNTGKLQWGEEYRNKHIDIYKECYRILKTSGIFIINISNHIRKGEEIDVCGWTKQQINDIGFVLVDEIKINTPRLKFGANSNIRCKNEYIYIFKK